MLFTGLAVLLFIGFVILFICALINLEDSMGLAGGLAAAAVLFLFGGWWFQTHRIVPTQYVGVTQSSLSQELAGPYPAGVVGKPFLGSVHTFPAASRLERCETYTPAIKGSYGITLDLCFYYDAGNIDWLKEVNATGSLDAGQIMAVWRNSVVGAVAQSVKTYTPEALSDNRAEVEQALYKNVDPWFKERGIPLVAVSFKNWDFTSPEVAASFDASIVSQRKITEQAALLEAAKISREREEYEAQTALIVAQVQKEALAQLGLEGEAAVNYLWLKTLSESGKVPDVLILGASNTPVSIPVKDQLPVGNVEAAAPAGQ